MGIVIRVDMGVVFLVAGTVLDFEGGGLDARVGEPVIVAFVEVLEVHVVAVGVLISGFGGIIIYN